MLFYLIFLLLLTPAYALTAAPSVPEVKTPDSSEEAQEKDPLFPFNFMPTGSKISLGISTLPIKKFSPYFDNNLDVGFYLNVIFELGEKYVMPNSYYRQFLGISYISFNNNLNSSHVAYTNSNRAILENTGNSYMLHYGVLWHFKNIFLAPSVGITYHSISGNMIEQSLRNDQKSSSTFDWSSIGLLPRMSIGYYPFENKNWYFSFTVDKHMLLNTKPDDQIWISSRKVEGNTSTSLSFGHNF